METFTTDGILFAIIKRKIGNHVLSFRFMEDRNKTKNKQFKPSSLFSSENKHGRSDFFISDSDELDEEFFETKVVKEKRKHKKVSDIFFLSDPPWEE